MYLYLSKAQRCRTRPMSFSPSAMGRHESRRGIIQVDTWDQTHMAGVKI